MRLLLDANLSPEVARRLSAAGHDAIHVAALGLLSAPDPEIMRAADEADRVLLTADSDFGALLALNSARGALRRPAALGRPHAPGRTG